MDVACLRRYDSGSIPYEGSDTSGEMTPVRTKRRGRHIHRSSVNFEHYLSSPHRHLQPCCENEEEVPARKALRCHVDLVLSRLPTCEWKRPAAGGSTGSGRVTTFHLEISGGTLLDVVIE